MRLYCLKKSILWTILFPFVLVAQEYDEVKPQEISPHKGSIINQEPPQKETIDKDAVLVEKLQGLVFTDYSKKYVFEEIKDQQGIVIEGIYVPREAKFKQLLSPYLGQKVTLNLLEEIRLEVMNFYEKEGYSLVGVNIPAGQEISTGVIHYVIVIGTLEEVKVEGAKNFDPDKLKKMIRTKEGSPIYSKTMNADLDWINNNPFRSVDIIYEQGEHLGGTDVVLKVDDRCPIRVYAGYDHNGYNIAGQSRFLTGFNWGNVFGYDHRLNFQFMSAESLEKWWGISGSYIVPFPWRNTLKFYGSYIKSRPDMPIDYVQYGKSWQLGGRYDIPFNWGKLRQGVVLGYDFKRTNNFLSYSENLVFNQYIDISQFVASYQGAYDDRWGMTNWDLNVYVSPGNMTHYNKDQYFDQERDGADSNYFYVTAALDRMTRLPWDFTWTFASMAQKASGKLMPTEEFSLGGYATVRGYEENEVIGDEGVLLRNELRAPSMKLFARGVKKDEMQFLAFIDMGWANDIDHNILSKDSTYIASFGPGFRYRFSRYFNASFDYGWQLKNIIRNYEPKKRHSRAHVSLLLSF